MSRIALVVLDTLRKDAFDEYFDWLPGRRFENCWSPSHWTPPVHASLFTGEYPADVGVYAKSPALECSRSVLAEQLSAMGYTTRAFSANSLVSREFDFDRGFDEFTGHWAVRPLNQNNLFDWDEVARKDENRPRKYLAGLKKCIQSDCDTIPSIRNAIERKLGRHGIGGKYKDDGATAGLEFVERIEFGDDEFLFLNFMEAHSPYKSPSNYRSVRTEGFLGIEETIRDSDLDGSIIRESYDGAVKYLANKYREIFSVLSEKMDYVITVSDHGELFGEHGAWRHDYGVYPELTHVPLIVSGDEITRTTCNRTISLTQVYHEIHDHAKGNGTQNARLFGDVSSQDVLSSYHGITHKRKTDKLVKNGHDRETIERYDEPMHGVATSSGQYAYGDYGGFHTEPGSDGAAAKDILSELLAERKSIGSENERIDISDTAAAQLEKLGYL